MLKNFLLEFAYTSNSGTKIYHVTIKTEEGTVITFDADEATLIVVSAEVGRVVKT